MHTIKITPNLLFGYQCTSGKFIRLPNRIETFLPELECSAGMHGLYVVRMPPNSSAQYANITYTPVSRLFSATRLFTRYGYAA